MKKLIIAALMAFSLTGLFAQGTKDSESVLLLQQAEKEEINGVIEMYGNMPFAIPALKTTDGKHYTLVAGEKVMKKLRECAGRRVKINGVINYPLKEDEMVFQFMEDGYIYVDSYEVIKPKKKDKTRISAE